MGLSMTVLAVLALYLLQLFLQETSRFGFDLGGIVGNRDRLPPLSVYAGRLERAKDNMREALPLFLGLAMLSLVRPEVPELARQGALFFLVARVLYVPAYLSGVPLLRSVLWLSGIAGLLMMGWPILAG
ncbi:MAG: hypothetical protein GC146_03115 [Limimaricola sp.]|uniref:MAPEG family protein n=1 Tax=Limimaricola sp. TaxID=2211665 RepID=UPI001DF8464A|nr:MAPEG family protein [Limimaricola sp.]MBI1416191.1 hypothetical protein [Limimaricola sp.]